MENQKRRNILSAALTVFFKYGYKRVSMNEIAEAASVSRPGLYLHFKSKEEVFNEAIRKHADDLIEEISAGLASYKSLEEKILFAFEVWAIKNFDQYIKSPEAREIADSSHLFANEATDASREKFEAILTSLLRVQPDSNKSKKMLSPQKSASVLAAALRGLKLTAKSSKELRSMIETLVRAFTSSI